MIPPTFDQLVSKNKWVEIFLVLGVFLSINLVSSWAQREIGVNNGIGYDGIVYYQMANDFHDHITPSQEPPFVFRVGLPLLACWLDSADIKRGFFLANLLANFVIVVLLFFWLGIWIQDWKLRLLLNILFQANWIGPVRFVWFYPTLTDNWAVAFILAGLLVLSSGFKEAWKSVLLAFLGFVGVFFREVIFVIPIAFLLTGWKQTPFSIGRIIFRPIPILTTLAGWWLVHQSFLVNIIRKPGHGFYTFYHTAETHFWGYPEFHKWLLAWFSAFGPAIGFLLIRPGISFDFLKRHWAIMIVFAELIFLSWLGGSDYERFFCWLSPIVWLLLGLTLESSRDFLKRKWLAVVFLGLQLLSERSFWAIPNFTRTRLCPLSDCKVLLTLFGDHVDYLDLQSWYEDPAVRMVRMIQYFLVLVVMGITYYWGVRKAEGSR